MKTILYSALILFTVLACKGNDPNEPTPTSIPSANGLKVDLDKKTIDKNDPLYTILSGYYEYNITPVDYIMDKINCKSTGLSKAWVSRKDDKTLQIHFVWIGYCTNQNPLVTNDFEFVATFTAKVPELPLTNRNRIDLTGVCSRVKPSDPKLLNQKVEGYAYLSPTLGEFVINLPDSKGIAQQIKAKMDIREYL